MKFKWCSVAGPKGENQDSILPPFVANGGTWCAIADGVGSSELGGVAARISVDVVRHAAGSGSMSDLFADVRRKLIEVSNEEDKAGRTMSTTLSVLCISGDQAIVGHVGDTRVSHYRGHGVMARTKDQTEVQKLLDDGVLTKNQAVRYPRRNVLLSAMSTRRPYDLYEQQFLIQNGDRILLTSDGFHTKLPRQTVANFSFSNPAFEDFWTSIETALSTKDLEDDASCLALEIE